MGKADKHLLEIVGRLYEAEGEVMGTRATKEQFAFLKERYPLLEYDEVSKIIKIEKPDKKRVGCSERRKQPRWRNILEPMWSVYMTWE